MMGARPELRLHSGRAPARALQPVGAWRTADGRIHGRSLVEGALRRLEWDHLGTFELDDRPPIVHAWPAPGVGPNALDVGFVRHVRPIVFQAWGAEALHASSVLAPGGALVFCGLSGAGKSTLACAFARRGWAQLGDDSVVWQHAGDGPAMLVLPFERRLREPSIRHFSSARRPPGRPRTHAGLPSTVPLGAIILLRQDPGLDDDVRLTPVHAAEGFARVLPHAHAFDTVDPAERRRLAEDYLELSARVPVFDVVYRPDFTRMSTLIDAVAALAPAARDHATASRS
jgi:hypothetical protein